MVSWFLWFCLNRGLFSLFLSVDSVIDIDDGVCSRCVVVFLILFFFVIVKKFCSILILIVILYLF